MKTRCLDHIDLRVKDMAAARKFYGKFLPQLGFVQEKPGRYYDTFYSSGGDKPSEFLGFTKDKNHKANGTRIALWADTREEVDPLAKLVCEAGVKALEGSGSLCWLQPGLLCVFFEDPDGNKLEVCCRGESDHCRLNCRDSRVGCGDRDFAGDTPAATVGE
jgi:catechol 2,3-dioxygenase-like lactoylglutathione lyase family enzyme